MATRNDLRQWFADHMKPTGAQFSNLFDSFWHKTEDSIPIAKIDGLPETLGQKASSADLAAKQDALTFDAQPTNGSANSVKSGGIFSWVSAQVDSLLTAIGLKADVSYVDDQVIQLLDGAPSAGDTLNKLYNLIQGLQAFINGDDINLDTIKELADAIKSDEDILTLLTTNKLNVSDVYNALDCSVSGKALDARQGKTLNDLISVLSGKVLPIGGTTGQVLAKGSDGNFDTLWIDPSGGISDLTPSQIVFGKNDGGIEQDSALEFDSTTNSLYVGGVGAAPAPGGNIYFYGTSITNGTGSSGSGKRFASIAAAALGLTEVNNGVSASTLEKQSPINVTGGVNMIDRLSNIPTKGSSDKYLIFEFGVNDWSYGGTNYNPTNFQSDYGTVISNALSKGWSANQILILSPTYVNPSMYGGTGAGGNVITQSGYTAFQTAAQAVSSTFGTKYFDAFTYIANRGGTYALSDSVHPNDVGHALMAMGIVEILASTVYGTGQSLAVNGIVEFLSLVLNTKYVLPDSTSSILGIDANGKVGIINAIKDGIKFNGNVNVVGQILQIGATNPAAGLGTNDVLLKQDAKIWSVFNTNANFQNFIKVLDGSAHMLFSVTYSGAQFRFSTVNGIVATIMPTGDLNLNGTVYSKALTITGGSGTYGSFEPYNVSNQTNIRNAYSGGYINFYVSNGVNAAQAKAFAINKMGRAIFQQSLPDNTDFALARLAINSTTEGFLTPRMTTNQRDAMSCLSTVTVGNFGSGYTTATVSVTGGGGSGAAVTAQIEVGGTGRIIGYTITNPGSGYTSLPTITVTGDGTGATANRTIALDGHEGLEIFNLTTHKKNYYDGSSWQEVSSTPV